MKTATVRELRNEFAKLEVWLAEGETVQIERRGQPVARLEPLPCFDRVAEHPPLPDYRARLKRIWGDRIFSVDEIRAERDYEREGQEG